MKAQPPKGTRDFYPPQMALRNHLLDAWRRVSVRNGFEQVDGPIFETLDLYKVKSGEGIVTELFHFEDRGERELAIRPEFTPTLARMVAAQAHALPKPIKWFCTPNLCRAERPQRGRLREFWQWNADILGLETPVADAECIFTAVDLLQELGLTPDHVRVQISHREVVRQVLGKLGVPEEGTSAAFELLDRRDKLDPAAFATGAARLGLDKDRVARFDQTCRLTYGAGRQSVGDGVSGPGLGGGLARIRALTGFDRELAALEALDAELDAFGIAEWCEYDLGIVRGLAYYTGTVFEIHEVSGAERALAGGGRYDGLIELFGGPPTPAVGFGMGDVVLSNVLEDKGLLPADATLRPDVFVLAATEAGASRLGGVVASLRRAGLHARFSYKTSRNVGKLMKDAAAAKARFVAILDDAASGGAVSLKDLGTGEQSEVPLGEVSTRVRGVSAET